MNTVYNLLIFGCMFTIGITVSHVKLRQNREEQELLDPKNRESVLKRCFYDSSERTKIVNQIDRMSKRMELDRLRLEVCVECNRNLEKLRSLKEAIQSDEYAKKLSSMSPSEIRLDNWDDF